MIHITKHSIYYDCITSMQMDYLIPRSQSRRRLRRGPVSVANQTLCVSRLLRWEMKIQQEGTNNIAFVIDFV